MRERNGGVEFDGMLQRRGGNGNTARRHLRDAKKQITLCGCDTLCMNMLQNLKRLLRLVGAKQQSGEGNRERGILRIKPHRLAQIM